MFQIKLLRETQDLFQTLFFYIVNSLRENCKTHPVFIRSFIYSFTPLHESSLDLKHANTRIASMHCAYVYTNRAHTFCTHLHESLLYLLQAYVRIASIPFAYV